MHRRKNQLKVSIIVCLTIIALSSCATQPPSQVKMPPIYSVNPVKQDSAWSKDWWEPRHQSKLKESKLVEVDLLMLGDSIMQGWEEEGKPTWQQFYQRRKAFNLGFNGDRTEHVLWRLRHGAVDHIRPKLVVLMIGTNNTGHRMDPAQHTAAGIKAIIAELQQRLPETKILLLGIFPRSASPFNDMRRRNDAINQIISTYADNQTVYYLDIKDAFLDEKGAVYPDIMPDMLHPSALGYQKWAEAMELKLNKLMDE